MLYTIIQDANGIATGFTEVSTGRSFTLQTPIPYQYLDNKLSAKGAIILDNGQRYSFVSAGGSALSTGALTALGLKTNVKFRAGFTYTTFPATFYGALGTLGFITTDPAGTFNNRITEYDFSFGVTKTFYIITFLLNFGVNQRVGSDLAIKFDISCSNSGKITIGKVVNQRRNTNTQFTANNLVSYNSIATDASVNIDVVEPDLIESETIIATSGSGGTTDLTNYYTKAEVDSNFTNNSNLLTKNNQTSTAQAEIGTEYKGTQSYGPDAIGNQFYGFGAKGEQLYGFQATGKIEIGSNNVNRDDGSVIDTLFSGSKSATFIEIIDAAKNITNTETIIADLTTAGAAAWIHSVYATDGTPLPTPAYQRLYSRGGTVNENEVLQISFNPAFYTFVGGKQWTLKRNATNNPVTTVLDLNAMGYKSGGAVSIVLEIEVSAVSGNNAQLDFLLAYGTGNPNGEANLNNSYWTTGTRTASKTLFMRNTINVAKPQRIAIRFELTQAEIDGGIEAYIRAENRNITIAGYKWIIGS